MGGGAARQLPTCAFHKKTHKRTYNFFAARNVCVLGKIGKNGARAKKAGERKKRKVLGNVGQRTPNPSTQSQQKTHATIFFSLSPIQRTFERPLQQTLTHPLSNPPTLTPTLQHKWSTRGGEDKKTLFFPSFSPTFRDITIYRISVIFYAYKI